MGLTITTLMHASSERNYHLDLAFSRYPTSDGVDGEVESPRTFDSTYTIVIAFPNRSSCFTSYCLLSWFTPKENFFVEVIQHPLFV